MEEKLPVPKHDDSDSDEDVFSELSTKISEIKEKLDDGNLNKNQRKNYRRKLKKLEDKF